MTAKPPKVTILLILMVIRAFSPYDWTFVTASFSRQHSSFNNSKAAIDRTSNRIADDSPLGCKELRSKRYISDGFCTSVRPITEVVCTGHCLPVNELPWYSHYVKMLSSRKAADEWRCIDDVIRHKRIYLLCENGERRSYRVRVVRSCKCKKYKKPHNKTSRKHDKEQLQFYD